MRRFIDLSIYLENDVVSDPPPMRPKIDYIRHDAGAEQMADFFEGLDKSELPDSEGWAIEMVQLCTHNGTHLDAPYHYHSTMNNKAGGAERAITIDEVPLEWCFQPGVKLDFRDKPDGYVVTANDVEAELTRIGVELEPLTIVLVNTSAGKTLWKRGLRQRRRRHGLRGHHVPFGAWCSRNRYRRMELGCAIFIHSRTLRR